MTDEAFEAIGQLGGAGREHFHEVLGTAGSLVGIKQHGLALMQDEIELSVVEAEFAPPLTHFVGNRDGLTPDRSDALTRVFGET